MIKKTIWILAVAIVLFSGMTSFAADTQTIYVSPDGSDYEYGTIERPLKTLEGARKKILELKEEGKTVTEVIFRGGEYRMRKTNFTSQDSGTETMPVVYKAYDGEKVIFKGSVELSFSSTVDISADVANRLKSGVRDKILCIELGKQGITDSEISDATEKNAYNTVYMNGVEGSLAQWPNGSRYARYGIVDGGTKSFTYTDDEPNRWQIDENAWIMAYANYDYARMTATITDIDTANNIITVNADAPYNFSNPYTKRWKIYNLIEELDTPGEFYIDKDKKLLYIYPIEGLNTLELSVEDNTMLYLEGVSNVTFSGITFCQSARNAVDMKDIVNVDFVGCTFQNIANRAIHAVGSQAISTGKGVNASALGFISNDASYKMDIRNCTFSNIGSLAVCTHGGNPDKLIPSENIIENNVFTMISSRSIDYGAVRLSGCGNTFRNNLITHCDGAAIMFGGNNHLIEKNEICDVIRDVGDAGAIYCGKNQLQRGTTIQYNYIHDIQPLDPDMNGGTVGIYMDDAQQGNIITKNIIYNVSLGYNSNGGGAMKVTNNVMINCEKPWNWHDAWGGNSDTVVNTMFDYTNHSDTLSQLEASIPNKDIYYEAYPELKKWIETKANPKKDNLYSKNLSVGPYLGVVKAQDAKYSVFSTTEGKTNDNMAVTATDEFVNPKSHDYRLVSGFYLSKLLEGSLTDANFDISDVGLQRAVDFSGADYCIKYPADGSEITDLNFEWQNAFGANKYIVEFFEDDSFTEPVLTKETPYNYLDLADTELKNGTEYYWRITAVSNSARLSGKWTGSSANGCFTLSK